MKKAFTKGIYPKLGQVPGALICIEQFKAESITLKNEKGGESSFCKFSDGSMTESSRLYIHAQMNEEKK